MFDVNGLEALLDQMHHCILTAEFKELPKIVEETERLVAQSALIADRAFAERLRQKANRNGLCLRAAACGLRAAQRRLGEMSTDGSHLLTYTSGGQRTEIGTGTNTLAQRL